MQTSFYDLTNPSEPFTDYVNIHFGSTPRPHLLALIQNYPYWKTLPASAISNEQITAFVTPGAYMESPLIPLTIRMMYELLKDITPDRELHKLLTFNVMSNMTRREVLKSQILNQLAGANLFDAPSQSLIHTSLTTPSQIVALFNTPKTEIRAQVMNPDFQALVTYLLNPEHHAQYLLRPQTENSVLVTNYHIHIANALDMGVLNKYIALLPTDAARIQLYICLLESTSNLNSNWNYDYQNQRTLLTFFEEALPSIFDTDYPDAFKAYNILKSIGATTEQLMSVAHTDTGILPEPLPELC